jgi:small subunit ribosomal protein S13
MRISGITLPDNKRIEIALTAVYGIGRERAHTILDAAGVSYGIYPKDIGEKEEIAIRTEAEKYTIEGDLKRHISGNIKRLKDIGTFRGSRHAKDLPARGQRTKTNSRTTRPYQGKKTMGSGRKKVDKK